MGGEGPFGGLEMGGMFSVLKVRRHQPHGDYKDPGWYQHPVGSVAKEYNGPLTEPARAQTQATSLAHPSASDAPSIDVQIQKPRHHMDH